MKKLPLISLILTFTFAFFSNAWADKTNEVLYLWVTKPDCSFDVVLPANATTGYQWELSNYDKELLKPIKSNYESPNTVRMGAGGSTRFTFIAKPVKSLQKTTLVFTYLRPWEKNSGTKQLVEVYFECPKTLEPGSNIIKVN